MILKAELKIYTLKDIRELNPCYDPDEILPEDWQGTVIDILNVKKCPHIDRLWVVIGFLDDRTNRLFACWCARQALALIEKPDQRSIAAVDVAERFANGEATQEELAAASAAACAAVWAAARDAAGDAARAAARAAAGAAARDAAWGAGRDAARDAAWDAQINYLTELINQTK